MAHAGRGLSEVVGGTGALHRMMFEGLTVAPEDAQSQGRAPGLLISSGMFGAERADVLSHANGPIPSWDGLGQSLSLEWFIRCPGIGLVLPQMPSHVTLHLAQAFCLGHSV